MRRTSFAELSAFVAVADHRSFTKAAVQLGLSTSSLSQSVRGLEEKLGVRLLNRTTRSVAPTDAGEQMLTRLRPLFDELDAAVDEANVFRDKPAGQLRLTVSPPVASFVLAPLLPEFLARYPQIIVDVSVDAELTDIVAGRYDAGIRVGGLIARDMIALRISDPLRYIVAASPDYLARHRQPATPKDLQAHNCIRLRFPSGAFLPWRFAVDGSIQELEVDASLIATDPNFLVSAAVDGVGVLYSLWDFAAPLVATGHLLALLENSMPPPSDGFYLYYPSKRQNPASLRVLIDFLRTKLDRTRTATAVDELILARQTAADA
jgi:LysR family transcriptional regulator, regulator of peptidoglycan recycling